MPIAKLPQKICSRSFGEDELAIVRSIIADSREEQSSRSEIARRVCAALDWRNVRGGLKEMGARVALLRLHRQGLITLPEPRARNWTGKSVQLNDAPVPEPPPSDFVAPLSALGSIRLRAVTNRDDSRLWNGLIDHYHYRAYSPLSGAQIRYLIESDLGLVGAIGFGAAACTLQARDRWIGWDRDQREREREKIVNNRRFLILPWIRVKNLASHILAKASRRIPLDFQARYGYAPVLLETFVEQDRFDGGCYRAANWIPVGTTSGRGRNDLTTKRERKQHGAPLPIKQIWLYPLRQDARRVLCGQPALTGGVA